MMRRMVFASGLLAVSTALLLGCDGDSAPTVDWYLAHKPEREQKLAECKNDPGRLAKTPSCINADAAEAKSFRQVPNGKQTSSGAGF